MYLTFEQEENEPASVEGNEPETLSVEYIDVAFDNEDNTETNGEGDCYDIVN